MVIGTYVLPRFWFCPALIALIWMGYRVHIDLPRDHACMNAPVYGPEPFSYIGTRGLRDYIG